MIIPVYLDWWELVEGSGRDVRYSVYLQFHLQHVSHNCGDCSLPSETHLIVPWAYSTPEHVTPFSYMMTA